MTALALLAALLLASPQESDLLEQARTALGRFEGAGPLQLAGRGSALALGLEGELTLALSSLGELALEVRSELPQARGFDGTRSWKRDHTGLARHVALEEAERTQVLAWVLSGHWLEAPELTRTASGPSELRLALTGTPFAARLALDPGTHLPRELVQLDTLSDRSWSLSDFRPVAGRKLPHRFVERHEGEEERYELTTLAPVARDPGAFRAPLAPPDDFELDLDAPAELAVGRLSSGHLFVEAEVEGESIGVFLFDTGAGINVIDRRLADELFLETLGSTVGEGVVGTTTSSFRRGTSFRLGPLTLTRPIFGDLDLGFAQSSSGPRVAGIVGHDVLARCVVEFEPATPRIVLHDPARFTLQGATWQPLALQDDLPCVRARFEGEREGLFRLDTGATGTVTFHTPAVEALKLLEGRKLTPTRSGGVGGTAEAALGTLAWFELAGRRFDSPEVVFSRTKDGAFADAYTTGNLGQTFLRPFRIVLDLAHERIAFVPLAR